MFERKVLFLCLLSSALQGCGSRLGFGGPIDGRYRLTAATCGGMDNLTTLKNGATGVSINIGNEAAVLMASYADGCLATTSLVFGYPSSGTLTLEATQTTCSSQCVTADNCIPSTTAVSALHPLTYSQDGALLTLTQPSSCGAGLTSDQVNVYSK